MNTKHSMGTITKVISEASVYFDLPQSGILEVKTNNEHVRASYSGIGEWTKKTPKEGMSVQLENLHNGDASFEAKPS